VKHLLINAEHITPPNDADSDRLLDDLRDGWIGRPLIVREDGDGGYIAATGAHRLAAAVELGMEVPVLLIEDEDLNFAAWSKLDDESDAEDILAFLLKQGLTEVAANLEEERDFFTSRYVQFIRGWLRPST
jgi:hypothetical protein